MICCLVAASGRCSSFSCHYELSAAAVDRKQIGNELPGNCEGGTVGMAFLLLRVIDQRQIRAQPWSKLGRFDQDRLQVLVPLLGDRHALDHVGGTSLRSAQPAVADGLLHRSEARYIIHLENPGQRRDRPDSGNRQVVKWIWLGGLGLWLLADFLLWKRVYEAQTVVQASSSTKRLSTISLLGLYWAFTAKRRVKS